MQMDEMLKLYVEKRRKYEEKIHSDLEQIEESVKNIVEVGDYFSIQDEELLITIKVVEIDCEKHLAILTDKIDTEIPFAKLSLTRHPDLILWIIQHDSLINQGFKELLINAVRNGEQIINTLKELKPNYE